MDIQAQSTASLGDFMGSWLKAFLPLFPSYKTGKILCSFTKVNGSCCHQGYPWLSFRISLLWVSRILLLGFSPTISRLAFSPWGCVLRGIPHPSCPFSQPKVLLLLCLRTLGPGALSCGVDAASSPGRDGCSRAGRGSC